MLPGLLPLVLVRNSVILPLPPPLEPDTLLGSLSHNKFVPLTLLGLEIVICTAPPEHIVVPPVILAVGVAYTIIDVLAVVEQPPAEAVSV